MIPTKEPLCVGLALGEDLQLQEHLLAEICSAHRIHKRRLLHLIVAWLQRPQTHIVREVELKSVCREIRPDRLRPHLPILPLHQFLNVPHDELEVDLERYLTLSTMQLCPAASQFVNRLGGNAMLPQDVS